MEEINKNDPDLKSLCVYAFDIISQKLLKENPPTPSFPQKLNNKSYPLFVTWTTGEKKSLRGCIGTFASEDLKENLTNYAQIAAFNDHRFTPITAKELPTLNCGISLLVNFEDAKDAYDWEIGKHGIQIEFSQDGYHRATFLPEVAAEQKWDQKTTLQHLIMKSGYYGDLEDVVNKIKLKRYQSIKALMTYSEYIATTNTQK